MRSIRFGWMPLALAVLMMAGLTSGCGGSKADVPIIVMGRTGVTEEVGTRLKDRLTKEIGDKPAVDVTALPIFSDQRLMVELAAASEAIFIVPRDSFESLAKSGNLVNLDGLFPTDAYPDGLVEAVPDERDAGAPKGKHLFGVPVAESEAMQAVGYKGDELYAFLHPRAKHLDDAKRVLQALAKR